MLEEQHLDHLPAARRKLPDGLAHQLFALHFGHQVGGNLLIGAEILDVLVVEIALAVGLA